MKLCKHEHTHVCIYCIHCELHSFEMIIATILMLPSICRLMHMHMYTSMGLLQSRLIVVSHLSHQLDLLESQESWIAKYESGKGSSNERPSGTIHDAAKGGKLEDVRKFIEAGDDINMQDEVYLIMLLISSLLVLIFHKEAYMFMIVSSLYVCV